MLVIVIEKMICKFYMKAKLKVPFFSPYKASEGTLSVRPTLNQTQDEVSWKIQRVQRIGIPLMGGRVSYYMSCLVLALLLTIVIPRPLPSHHKAVRMKI